MERWTDRHMFSQTPVLDRQTHAVLWTSLSQETDTLSAGDQSYLQGVPRYDQCTIMLPSKRIQLQMGLSPTGYLH
jgi:hypothetical protein